MNSLTVSRKLVELGRRLVTLTYRITVRAEDAALSFRRAATDAHVNRLRAARKEGQAAVIAAAVRTEKFVSDCKTRAQEQAHAATVAEAELAAVQRKQAAINVALSLEAAKYGRIL